jgi:putative Ca2+/H+ antiporter (TMEM165/GDT1 family)
MFLQALFVSTAVVAIGEIGDKTQLLALMLAARFRRPWPIVLGIAVATLANHALAGWVGNWVRATVPADVLKWLLAIAFFAVAAWALKPDRLDKEPAEHSRLGVFTVTTVAFFLTEMGDKTQVATVMLAAQFTSLAAVIVGTTLGMLLANVPVVLAGKIASERIPFRAIRILAALLFAAIGVWVLIQGVPGAPSPGEAAKPAGIINGLPR